MPSYFAQEVVLGGVPVNFNQLIHDESLLGQTIGALMHLSYDSTDYMVRTEKEEEIEEVELELLVNFLHPFFGTIQGM